MEGVDETGIHIKELWKINQDYKDVMAQKLKESQTGAHIGNVDLCSFEFRTANEDALKDLAKRVGQVVKQSVPLEYFMNGKSAKDHREDLSRNYRGSRYDQRFEHVPTFGLGNNENSNNYADSKFTGGYDYSKGNYKDYKSISPVRQQKLSYEPSRQVNELAKSSNFSPPRDQKYDYYDKYSGEKNYDRMYDNTREHPQYAPPRNYDNYEAKIAGDRHALTSKYDK